MVLIPLEMSIFEVANTVSGDPMNKIEKIVVADHWKQWIARDGLYEKETARNNIFGLVRNPDR